MRRVRYWIVLFLPVFFVTSSLLGAARVEFIFEVPDSDGNPFAREVWATVVKPSGSEFTVPAFWAGSSRFAVRISGDEVGAYRLASVVEILDGTRVQHPVVRVGDVVIDVDSRFDMPLVRLDPTSRWDFAYDDGSRFVPIGGNIHANESMGDSLEQGLVEYYQQRFGQFSEAGLNWARIWMINWSSLNLDWLPREIPEQPMPGWIDTTVANSWDQIIESAEENGVYVQMVLQNHGQYSTETNPKWSFNPWNATQKHGFLERPGEFFTSEMARELTKRKYRYIVARWGYSPAILAWELFNEVHWVDAIRYDLDEAAVAAWHDEMASYLRSIDVHGHLITTSIEDIQSPVNAQMDYLQPHIYGVDMISNMRYVDPAYFEIGKPAFFGEFGDDHMPLTRAEKDTGVSIIPPIWAGIMGLLHLPPQTGFIHRLIETGNLDKLGSVARFLERTGLAVRDDLVPFSPRVESQDRIPYVVKPGFVWMNRPGLTVELPDDGSAPTSMALVPGVLVADELGFKRGFANQVRFVVDWSEPQHVAANVRLNRGDSLGSVVEITVDSDVAASHTWRPQDMEADDDGSVELEFEIPPGPHEVSVENAGGPGWFHFDSLDTRLEIPRIAAVGKRTLDFVALWIWNRDGVFNTEAVGASSGTLFVEELPAGTWRIEWWDTDRGVPVLDAVRDHDGGTFELSTAAIDRHAAVVLTRLP